MSYTPSTDEVRLAYVAGTAERERIEVRSEAWLRLFDEFDRWLAGVKVEAWDEGEKAGETNAGVGMASLLTGLPAPASEVNPYREGVDG